LRTIQYVQFILQIPLPSWCIVLVRRRGCAVLGVSVLLSSLTTIPLLAAVLFLVLPLPVVVIVIVVVVLFCVIVLVLGVLVVGRRRRPRPSPSCLYPLPPREQLLAAAAAVRGGVVVAVVVVSFSSPSSSRSSAVAVLGTLVALWSSCPFRRPCPCHPLRPRAWRRVRWAVLGVLALLLSFLSPRQRLGAVVVAIVGGGGGRLAAVSQVPWCPVVLLSGLVFVPVIVPWSWVAGCSSLLSWSSLPALPRCRCHPRCHCHQ
jgi:hypothetical protein